MKRSLQISLWQYGDGLLSDHDVEILQEVLDLLSNAITAEKIHLKGDLYNTRQYSEWKAKDFDIGLVRTITTANDEAVTRELAMEVYRRIDEIAGAQFVATNYHEPEK